MTGCAHWASARDENTEEPMKRCLMHAGLLLILLFTVADPQAMRAQTTADKSVPDCGVGRSALTPPQCAFILKMNDANRQLNALIDSGEFVKLSPNTKKVMLALIDALAAAMPLAKR
jgi:hypothetical protein